MKNHHHAALSVISYAAKRATFAADFKSAINKSLLVLAVTDPAAEAVAPAKDLFQQAYQDPM